MMNPGTIDKVCICIYSICSVTGFGFATVDLCLEIMNIKTNGACKITCPHTKTLENMYTLILKGVQHLGFFRISYNGQSPNTQ
jgi:hypothetical protein